MIKKVFFMLILMALASKITLAADCSTINFNPQITLTSSYGKLSLDNTKTKADITELAKSLNLVEHGLFASGLSTVNINFDLAFNASGLPVEEGLFCVVPTQISIFFGLDNPVIYLAKELSPKSCEYNMVLRHEQTHQQINKSTLEYYLPLFKNAAKKIADNMEPVAVKDIKDIKEAIQKQTLIYNQKINKAIDFIKKEMLTEQAKLDNPRNYLLESNLCP